MKLARCFLVAVMAAICWLPSASWAQGYIVLPAGVACGSITQPPAGIAPGYMTSTGLICDGASGGSGSPVAVSSSPLTPVAGSQEGLAIVTATALTVPATATTALITVEGNSVRYRCDGTAPTASSGSLIANGTQGAVFKTTPLTACQFIQTGATATLDVEYFY